MEKGNSMNFLSFWRFAGSLFAKPSSIFISGWLVLCGSFLSWAGSATAQSAFPKPYVMENSDMGVGTVDTGLNKTVGLPEWASIAVQHRSRFETLDDSFRARSTGGDQVFSLRTLAQGELRLSKNFKLKAELEDSRAELVDAETLLNNTMVDVAELLEANLQWDAENLFLDGSKSVLRVGRLTMDMENRRLVARNRFRNTINSFTGLDFCFISETALGQRRVLFFWFE